MVVTIATNIIVLIINSHPVTIKKISIAGTNAIYNNFRFRVACEPQILASSIELKVIVGVSVVEFIALTRKLIEFMQEITNYVWEIKSYLGM